MTGLAAALACAALMGVAIQRGGTCTVAAVEDLLAGGRPHRLLALVEASLWVGVGLLVVREAVGPMAWPAGQGLTGWTVVGAALLGAGALVNGACAFGSVARLGAGQWAYAATPLGFYAGGLSLQPVWGAMLRHPLGMDAPLLAAPSWLAWTLCGVASARLVLPVLRPRTGGAWSPHLATAVIGLSFLGLAVLAGAWAYTDVLADLARGMARALGDRGALGLTLLAGAVIAAVVGGAWQPRRPRPRAVLRCFAGGVLMGWGGLLVPGGNDALVLLGMPLLWPYAWAAFAVMCLVIAAGLHIAGRFSGQPLLPPRP
jgi:toxin CptA